MIFQVDLVYQNYGLKPLKPSDVDENYVNWLNDPEVTSNLEVGTQEHTKESLINYVEEHEMSSNSGLLAIFDIAENKHIGNASIYGINKYHGTFDIGYFIGDKSYWGKNVGRATCILMLSLAFDQLKLRKVFTYVAKKNMKSRFILQGLKFEKEAVLDSYRRLKDDSYTDMVIYSLSSHQWDAITKPNLKI